MTETIHFGPPQVPWWVWKVAVIDDKVLRNRLVKPWARYLPGYKQIRLWCVKQYLFSRTTDHSE